MLNKTNFFLLAQIKQYFEVGLTEISNGVFHKVARILGIISGASRYIPDHIMHWSMPLCFLVFLPSLLVHKAEPYDHSL